MSTSCGASPPSRSGVIPTRATAAVASTARYASQPTRTEALQRLTIPTVVIHGTADTMCHPSGGRATADAIPGAHLELITGMGHDLPRGAWPRLTRAIADNGHAEQA